MNYSDDINTPMWKFVLAALTGMLMITCSMIFGINAFTQRIFDFPALKQIMPTATLQPLPRSQGTLEIVGNPAQSAVVTVRGRSFKPGDRVELYFARNESEPYTQWSKFAEALGEERVKADGTFAMNFVTLPRELLVGGLLIAREANGGVAAPVSFAAGAITPQNGPITINLQPAPTPGTAPIAGATTRPSIATVAAAPATSTLQGPIATATLAPFAPNAWMAEYYQDRMFSSSPSVRRGEAELNFNWLRGSPDPAIPVDNWAAKFSKQIDVPSADNYEFVLNMDDGARLYVDEELLIGNQWYEGPFRSASANKFMRAGRHTVRVEYFEAAGYATLSLKYGPHYKGWKGVYYNSPNLEGAPVLIRDDEKLDFAWGFYPPGVGVFGDGFSVEWARILNIPSSGQWLFTAVADDGVRVIVDGQLVIDEYDKNGLSAVGGLVNLTQGEHQVTVQYNDRAGNAQIKVDWSPYPPPATATPIIISSSTPVPATPVPATPVPATPVPATPVPATPVPPTQTPVPATTLPPTSIPSTREPAATSLGATAIYTVTPVSIPTSKP